MNFRRFHQKGAIVSCMLVLLLSVQGGFVAESYSSQNSWTDGEIQGTVLTLTRPGMDSRIDSHGVGIHMENGYVKIFGIVNSLKEKHMTSRIASSIDGVNSILNSLRIKSDMDEDRRKRVGIEPLMETAGTKRTDSIKLNMENAVVPLKELISTRKDKNAIHNISENRPGVTEVKNVVAVSGCVRGDRDIHKDILFYLLWSPFFKKDEIPVEVKVGTVKLNGHIDFLAKKPSLSKIENIFRELSG